MAKYTVLTPDAQHDDDHRVEREIAGGDVDFIHYNTADASDTANTTGDTGFCDGLYNIIFR